MSESSPLGHEAKRNSHLTVSASAAALFLLLYLMRGRLHALVSTLVLVRHIHFVRVWEPAINHTYKLKQARKGSMQFFCSSNFSEFICVYGITSLQN